MKLDDIRLIALQPTHLLDKYTGDMWLPGSFIPTGSIFKIDRATMRRTYARTPHAGWRGQPRSAPRRMDENVVCSKIDLLITCVSKHIPNTFFYSIIVDLKSRQVYSIFYDQFAFAAGSLDDIVENATVHVN